MRIGGTCQIVATPPQLTQTDWLIAAERLRELASSTAEWPIFAFHGHDELSQRAGARLVAGQMGRPILLVDMAALLKNELTPNALCGWPCAMRC